MQPSANKTAQFLSKMQLSSGRTWMVHFAHCCLQLAVKNVHPVYYLSGKDRNKARLVLGSLQFFANQQRWQTA